MLKQSTSCVIASLRASTYRSLRLASSPAAALQGQGASQGEEAVLADSGREGEISARVGLVRSLAFLNILRRVHPVVQNVRISDVLACPHSFSAACWESLMERRLPVQRLQHMLYQVAI